MCSGWFIKLLPVKAITCSPFLKFSKPPWLKLLSQIFSAVCQTVKLPKSLGALLLAEEAPRPVPIQVLNYAIFDCSKCPPKSD